MEIKPAKRLGRPRKDTPRAVAADEGQSLPANDVGHGEAGTAGPGAPAHAGGQGKGLDWNELVALVRIKHSPAHQVATIFHPSPRAELVDTNHGWISVAKGRPGYQLSSGEVVDL